MQAVLMSFLRQPLSAFDRPASPLPDAQDHDFGKVMNRLVSKDDTGGKEPRLQDDAPLSAHPGPEPAQGSAPVMAAQAGVAPSEALQEPSQGTPGTASAADRLAVCDNAEAGAGWMPLSVAALPTATEDQADFAVSFMSGSQENRITASRSLAVPDLVTMAPGMAMPAGPLLEPDLCFAGQDETLQPGSTLDVVKPAATFGGALSDWSDAAPALTKTASETSVLIGPQLISGPPPATETRAAIQPGIARHGSESFVLRRDLMQPVQSGGGAGQAVFASASGLEGAAEQLDSAAARLPGNAASQPGAGPVGQVTGTVILADGGVATVPATGNAASQPGAGPTGQVTGTVVPADNSVAAAAQPATGQIFVRGEMIPASFAVHSPGTGEEAAPLTPKRLVPGQDTNPAEKAGKDQVQSAARDPAMPVSATTFFPALDGLVQDVAWVGGKPESQHSTVLPLGVPSGAAPMHGAATPHILLARNLADLVKAGQTGPVELSLSPQELGRLRISLSPDGEGLHVAVQVERNETLDLLRRNTDMLLQEIRAQGFSGASFSFSGWSGEKTAASSGSSPATGMPATSPEPSVFRPAPSTGLDLRL